MTRTVCRGPANRELKKLYYAVKAAQAAALRAVKPGVCADEIHRLCQQLFEARGFKTYEKNGTHVGFIHGTGHGVGLDIHELPRVGRGNPGGRKCDYGRTGALLSRTRRCAHRGYRRRYRKGIPLPGGLPEKI